MIKFEDIKKANDSIMTTEIKGKDYAEVNQRIKAFRMCYPTGTITTEIIALENGVVTMQAFVKDEDGKVLGTGLAQEKETSSFINRTSYIENCETSAVGRALGMCGFGIDTSICSAEELKNALENQKGEDGKKPDEKPTKAEQKKAQDINSKFATETQIKTILRLYEGKEDKLEELLQIYKVKELQELTLVTASDIIKKLNAKAGK